MFAAWARAKPGTRTIRNAGIIRNKSPTSGRIKNVTIRHVDTPSHIAQGRRCARRQPGHRRAVHRHRARRGAGQDRHGQSADRRVVGTGAKRGRRRQICRGRDQQEGRHFGPPGPAPGRGFGQRRRHRRAEDAQADRPRSGLRHPRRRQFRHRLRHVAGDVREESVPHRARRPHRSDHRHQLQMERVPRLQHHVDGRQRGDAGAGEEDSARNGSSSRRITPTATPCRTPSSRR